MSVRTFVILGLVVVAAFTAWRVLLPTANETAEDAAGGVAALLDTTAQAQFTGAQATLEVQRRTTGSYAGAAIQAPLRLVRADATAYCLELVRGGQVASVSGPGGSPRAGRC